MRTLQNQLVAIILPITVSCIFILATIVANSNSGSGNTTGTLSNLIDTQRYSAATRYAPGPRTDSARQAENASEAYTAFLYIWADAEHLYKIVVQYEQDEMDDLNKVNALLLLATLIRKVEIEHQSIEVPTVFAPPWEDALKVHNITRNYIERLGYIEIDPAQVIEGMEPELLAIRQTLTHVESILINEFDLNPVEIRRQREELMEKYSIIFIPVPTADQEN